MQAVLVGSSDRQLHEMLESHGMRVIGISVSELPALAERSTHQPELVLLDVRTNASIPPALAALKRKHPATPVLLVASRLDPTLMLEAMRAGVNECVVPPLTEEQLAAALARVLANSPSGETGQVIAVVGAKGGAGTTTVASSIAAVLGQAAPGSALLMDLHAWCGDAALALGATPRFSVADAIDNVHRFDETFFRGLVVRAPSGADVLTSPDLPLPVPLDPGQQRALVDYAAQLYRYTVLDMPRAGGTSLDVLDSATAVAIVTTQEVAALRSAKFLYDVLADRIGRDRLHLVVNRFDRRSELGIEDVEDAVGGPVRHQLPNDYRSVIGALNAGRPLVLDADRKVGAALRAMAMAIAGLEGQEPAASAERAGFFSRLKVRRYATAG